MLASEELSLGWSQYREREAVVGVAGVAMSASSALDSLVSMSRGRKYLVRPVGEAKGRRGGCRVCGWGGGDAMVLSLVLVGRVVVSSVDGVPVVVLVQSGGVGVLRV